MSATDNYDADDCECPACKAGLPKSRMVPVELPNGQKVILKLSSKAYEKLRELIEQRTW
jgi:hypothetical protein